MNNCLELYLVTDVINGDEIAYFAAKNDKDAVRNLVRMGMFKFNRIDELKLEKAELCKTGEVIEIDIKTIINELKYVENESEKIEGSTEEVKEKILDESSGNK